VREIRVGRGHAAVLGGSVVAVVLPVLIGSAGLKAWLWGRVGYLPDEVGVSFCLPALQLTPPAVRGWGWMQTLTEDLGAVALGGVTAWRLFARSAYLDDAAWWRVILVGWMAFVGASAVASALFALCFALVTGGGPASVFFAIVAGIIGTLWGVPLGLLPGLGAATARLLTRRRSA
jgi:hypothetical protein